MKTSKRIGSLEAFCSEMATMSFRGRHEGPKALRESQKFIPGCRTLHDRDDLTLEYAQT